MKAKLVAILQNRQFKKTTVIFATVFVLFLVSLILNWAILALFRQKSTYRAEHGLVGIVLLMGFYYLLKDRGSSKIQLGLLFLLSLIPCYFGTVFPDLDIKFLGIGGHRNPLFHSGLLFFFLLFLLRRNPSIFLHTLVSGFGVGIASHLLWDLFDRADVRWLPGGTLDRFWLGMNGFLCLILARRFLASRLTRSDGAKK